MRECSPFPGSNGMRESFYTLYSSPHKDFSREAEGLLLRYRELSHGSFPLLVRFHVSDIANQYDLLRELLSRYGIANAAVVGQPPLHGGRIALEAWHFSRPPENYELHLINTRGGEVQGSEAQMRAEFEKLQLALSGEDASVAANVVRTWIYCRDLDNNYAGLVKARRELFLRWGLTADTHYIASTGIEGASVPHDRLIRMDSLAVFGHRAEQVEYMHAPEHMSPTHLYGVTFERGTRIIYGDRSHYFISGTASIDNAGNIMHVGDVEKQAERMVVNVEALLSRHGASLADLKQAVVYLRDAADKGIVEKVLQRHLSPDTGYIMLRAAVCRPGWLLEMDGIAVNGSGNPEFKAFA